MFGGELVFTTRGDVDPSTPDAEPAQIINSSLVGGDISIRASGRADATPGPQTRVAHSVIGADGPKRRSLFDDLAAGGSVDVPLERQFWGDTFGTLTDGFGISWPVDIEEGG